MESFSLLQFYAGINSVAYSRLENHALIIRIKISQQFFYEKLRARKMGAKGGTIYIINIKNMCM